LGFLLRFASTQASPASSPPPWVVCTVAERVYPRRCCRTIGLRRVGLRSSLQKWRKAFASFPTRDWLRRRLVSFFVTLAEIIYYQIKPKDSREIKHKQDREFNMDEPTMEEKLSSLDMLNDEKLDTKAIPEPAVTVELPRADSLHILLRQALHAEDQALLLDCLYTRDEKVIAKSIALLNPANVVKLLKCLLFMAESRGAVLVCALPWIRILLCQQASSIMSQESSIRILNSLYQLIDSRISTFGSALQLSSCLDHLFPRVTDDGGADQPIIYENSDSEESEDAMETDEGSEGLSDVTDAHGSDLSDVMSDEDGGH
ncbi:unnamed protein product, partial [Musa acuminata subsp. malaccensis]